MPKVGTGEYTYELIRDFLKLPTGESFGMVSRVATDSQDRVYVFQRKDPPVVVFDRDGKYLGAWGSRRGHRPARPEDRRRRRLHHRSLRLGREVVHAGRQAAAGARPARRAFRHRLHRLPLARRTRGGAVQSSDRDDGPSQRRHLRDRRLPQRPRAPLHARRPARQVVGRAGQRRGPVPPAAQHRDRPRRQALRRRPGEQAHPDLLARRRLPRPVDRHGRAERHHARQGRQVLHRRAGRRRQSRVCLRARCGRETCSPAWRAAMSTASAWTRAATSTPD